MRSWWADCECCAVAYSADMPDVYFPRRAHRSEFLGLRGLKVHPGAQGFAPDDRAVYPIWETAQ